MIRAKFEGNPIMCLRVMEVFCKCAKRKKREKKKPKKMSNFLKAYISGTAGAIYFRSSMCSLSICRHLHSEFGLAWSRDHRATNGHKIALCSSY